MGVWLRAAGRLLVLASILDGREIDADGGGAPLTIGSPAPTLRIEHWLNGEQRGDPIDRFEPGKVYVVEFWATWCGPCIANLPRLVETQQRYRDRGVVVIGVSDEELSIVEPFLARPVAEFLEIDAPASERRPTYGELTSAYRLATDPDRSTHEAYMAAASQASFPTVFLVGKTGLIEWVGHPSEMENPLEQVVTGQWDREPFAREFRSIQEVTALAIAGFEALDEEDLATALKTSEELAAFTAPGPAPDRAVNYAQMLRRRLIVPLIETDTERALSLLRETVEQSEGNPQLVNRTTWGLVKLVDQGTELPEEVLLACAELTEGALSEAAPEGTLLDTIAHCYEHLGEIDKAIAYQRRAVAAGQDESDADLQAEIEDYLAHLLGKKAEGSGD